MSVCVLDKPQEPHCVCFNETTATCSLTGRSIATLLLCEFENNEWIGKTYTSYFKAWKKTIIYKITHAHAWKKTIIYKITHAHA